MEKKFFWFLVILLVVGGFYFYTQKNKTFLNRLRLKITPTPTQGQEIRSTIGVTEETEIIRPTETKATEMFLEIYQPQNGATVNNSSLTVEGKTTAFASVFINEKELRADVAGRFSTVITLDEGENTIIIVANDEEGNYEEKEIKVILETLE